MDFESFNQCLTYVQSLKKPASIFETYQPVATTLLGIFVGFAINLMRDAFKEKSLERKKQACILEEIKSTQSIMENCLREAFHLMDLMDKFGSIAGGQFPVRTDMTITQEFFKSIAHTYHYEDMKKISRLIDETSTLTGIIQEFRQEKTAASQSYKLMNIINLSSSCHAVSEAIINKSEIKISTPSITKKLKIETRLTKELAGK